MPGDKFKIIIIEPDLRSWKDLEFKLSPAYHVIGVQLIDRLMSTLRAEPNAKAVVISTAKGLDVLGLFNTIRREHPTMLRVLLTAFEDLSQVVEGLHSGTVQRILSKPLHAVEFFGMVRTAHTAGSHYDSASAS